MNGGKKRRLAAEINVVPYIDVMLVLLVIFMIPAPLLTQGVEVDLPDANTEPIAAPEEPVTLFIDARGRYFVDIGAGQDRPLSDDEVVRRIGAVLRNKPDTMILVKGDKRVAYDKVAYGMGLLQEAGARKIGFSTDPLPPRKAADALRQ
ncbi:MAG: protein TolR [Gammaproteobacteria bacterium]|nr:protein TolR [Gammaproteobacteria bacterium]